MQEEIEQATESRITSVIGRTLSDKEKLILRMGISAGLKGLEDRLLTIEGSEFQQSRSPNGPDFSLSDFCAGVKTGLIMARQESIKIRS